MRLTICLLLLFTGFVFAENATSQNTRVNLNKSKAILKEVLEEIELQTDYLFVSNLNVDLEQRVSVKANNKPVQEALNELLKNTDLTYSIEGVNIVLSRKNVSEARQQAQKKITGFVKDAKGEAIIGANIVEKGTTNGIMTDLDGHFQLEVSPDAIIAVSYIGYNPQDVSIKGKNEIEIVLVENTLALDEVVVVGYGSVRKSDLTSSVTSVRAEDITVSATPSIATALQGIAPGVEIATNSASPGGNIDVRIRGVGTLNNTAPLFVVDGLPVNSVEFVNTNDVERMEILKDATSAAIYGSRGSNGVVLITTKSGKNSHGAYSIHFDGSYGTQSLAHKLKMADATEYAMIFNEARANSNMDGRIDVNSIRGKGTDWIEEITRNLAPMQSYNLNVTGGNDISSISAGIGYYGQDGVIKSSDYERFSARINANVQPNKVVSFNFNMIAGHTSRNMISGEKDQYSGLLFNVFLIDPITEVMKPESEWVDNPYSNYARSIYTEIGNPAGLMARTFNTAKQYSGVANIGMKLDFTKDLSFKTNIGADYRDSKRKTFSPNFYVNPSEKNDNNRIENENIYRLNYAWENTLNYQATFLNKHRLSVLLGYTMEFNKRENLIASRTNTPGNAIELQYIQLGTQNPDASGDFSKNTMISYLGRINYNYQDKYIVTANFREDGSSRFAKGNKWGFFPSVSGAWILSNEDFFPSNLVDYLKLRMGYGQIGNQNIANYAYLNQIRNVYRYPFGDALLSGLATYIPGNKEVKWETTEDVSIGIDGTSNHFNWTIDLYQRKTRDMLLNNPVPGYTGLYSSPTDLNAGIWDNVGSIENRGLELSLEYRGKIEAFTYRAGGNISFVKNEITELGSVNFITSANVRGLGDISRSQVGSSVARFYGYKTDGIFKSEAEVQAYAKDGVPIQGNARPGDLKYVDKDGNGQINDADKDWIGSPLPLFTSGFNLNLEYKGFDLKGYFYWVYGNDIMDASSIFYDGGKDVYNSLAGTYAKAWRTDNPNATHTRLSSRDENGNFQKFSDYMIQNGSYVRLKDIQVGYNFKPEQLDRWGIKRLRLYLAAQNLFTLTAYKGLEPETSSDNVNILGIDYGNYPTARTFMFGLNVTF
ncbi:MAG: TonB-dependent receptor [Tannerellaceae bacterium]|nr:TonB-dependent receptor [Tannerellaceae bacterium]